jgi:arginase
VVEMAIERAGDGVDGIHLSLDLDVVDPMQAPGWGLPCRAGSPIVRPNSPWR